MISMNKEYHLGTLRKGLNAVKEARGWGVGGKKEEGHRQAQIPGRMSEW